MARDWKAEYRARAEYLKAYRRKNKDKDASRARARRSLGNIPDGHEVDHKDGNPMNNKRENLKIVPRRTNRAKGARKTNKMR
jgi:hypothetical protein